MGVRFAKSVSWQPRLQPTYSGVNIFFHILGDLEWGHRVLLSHFGVDLWWARRGFSHILGEFDASRLNAKKTRLRVEGHWSAWSPGRSHLNGRRGKRIGYPCSNLYWRILLVLRERAGMTAIFEPYWWFPTKGDPFIPSFYWWFLLRGPVHSLISYFLHQQVMCLQLTPQVDGLDTSRIWTLLVAHVNVAHRGVPFGEMNHWVFFYVCSMIIEN